jgi:hypothetical protein
MSHVNQTAHIAPLRRQPFFITIFLFGSGRLGVGGVANWRAAAEDSAAAAVTFLFERPFVQQMT